MSVHFLYVRHGETLFNVCERAQGWCDSPLTERGVEQAQVCARRLADTRIDRAFCSPSGRAVDTAAIVLEGHGVTASPLLGLREMYFGELEGERIGADPRMLAYWEALDFTPVGGESASQVLLRIRETFAQMVGECADGEQVLVVSHRGYFLFMLAALFGWGLEDAVLAPDSLDLIPNASVARFTWDGAWRLDSMPS